MAFKIFSLVIFLCCFLAPASCADEQTANFVQLYLLSPESAAGSSEPLSHFDADHNGVLNMEDYAILSGKPGSWKVIYVAPAGPAGNVGDGSLLHPFGICDGNEYEFNQLLRPLLDAGVNVDVVFRDGTYRNVRLHIVKQGIDTDEVCMQDPTGSPDIVNGVPRYKPLAYRIRKCCNRQGQNCRLPAEFCTMGPHCQSTLVLRAATPGRAVFDGRKYQEVHKNLGASAIQISGACLTAGDDYPRDCQSERISNVIVTGFLIQNYTGGVGVTHAEKVVVKNCQLNDIGSRNISDRSTEVFGTSVLRTDGGSQSIVFKNNQINNSWNTENPATVMKNMEMSTFGLIHPFYFGYAKDVAFLGNRMINASGPFIKFGFYPHKKDGFIVTEYPTTVEERRNFFIGNRCVQDKVIRYQQPGMFEPKLAGFINDNGVYQDKAGRLSAPAMGEIFLNNTFQLAAIPELVDAMPFLIDNRPYKQYRHPYSAWVFAGNSIVGVSKNRLICSRLAGTDVSGKSVDDIDSLAYESRFHLLEQLGSSAPRLNRQQLEEEIHRLIVGPLRSSDPVRDQFVETVVLRQGIPGLDLPK